MSKQKRNIPPLVTVPVLDEFASRTLSKSYTLKLITPMFGGGAHAGEVDPQMPIRVSSIRGHLRYWWRLLNRHRFVVNGLLDVVGMRNAEITIWGSTEIPSPVDIIVRVSNESIRTKECGQWKQYTRTNGKPGTRFEWNAPFDQKLGTSQNESMPLPYALFPFTGVAPKDEQGRFPTKPGATSLIHATFDIEISFPLNRMEAAIFESQVISTFETWLRWGGLGARTRRGLGVMEIITGSAKSYLECIPNGCGLMVGQSFGKSPNDAIKAWSKAVLALMDFRQRMYRNRGPGRTNWPEPDSIRDITGFSSSAHETPINAATVGTFPRAWFGLPIIFHFQSSGRSAGDPPDITLEPLSDSKADPSERGRMASPIMLRPMYDAAGWRPALLQLPVEHLTSLNCRLHTDDAELLSELKMGNKQIVQGDQLWGSKVAKSKPIADQFPATDSQSGANAIVAFTRFLKKHHGFEWAN